MTKSELITQFAKDLKLTPDEFMEIQIHNRESGRTSHWRRDGEEFELKPCPFCGGKAVHILVSKNYPRVHQFECEYLYDNCSMDARTHLYEEKEDAVKAWNARAPLTLEEG